LGTSDDVGALRGRGKKALGPTEGFALKLEDGETVRLAVKGKKTAAEAG